MNCRREFFYSSEALGWEIAMVVFMTITDLSRQMLATKGNLTGKGEPLLFSCGLAVPVLIGHCFFLRLQSYV
jgi:hypothetical protein